jgi:hypothetical protein
LPPGTGECNPTLIFPLAAIPLGLLALVGWPVWTIVRLLERRRAPPAPPPNFEDAPPGDTLGG